MHINNIFSEMFSEDSQNKIDKFSLLYIRFRNRMRKSRILCVCVVIQVSLVNDDISKIMRIMIKHVRNADEQMNNEYYI